MAELRGVIETSLKKALDSKATIDTNQDGKISKKEYAITMPKKFGEIDEHGMDSFDRRLAAAAAAEAGEDRKVGQLRRMLGDLRSTFPEESSEFAVLIFSCMELIEAWSEHVRGGKAPSAAELARKEELLTRVCALLEPRAGEALHGFVTHIVTTSRKARQQG